MLTFIYFLLVLGVTVFVHELGHFIFAKKAGVYVYEFSLGMGPCLFKRKSKKSETVYSLRLLPIGGYVQLAGEDVELDKDIPENMRMQSKTWFQRFMVMIAGVLFNFILAIILFIIVGLINGVPTSKPIVNNVLLDSPAYNTNMATNDVITKINGKKISDMDMFNLEFSVYTGTKIDFEVKKENGIVENIVIEPNVITDEEGNQSYQYGFSLKSENKKGILEAIKYGFMKVFSLIKQMFFIILYLITGKLSLNNLAGPVGIYEVVGQTASLGFINVIFLIGYICTNVGFVNLVPFPAFDGGRVLFLIIEKIRRKPMSPKVENIIHSIGFMLLIAFMIFITINDVTRLFG